MNSDECFFFTCKQSHAGFSHDVATIVKRKVKQRAEQLSTGDKNTHKTEIFSYDKRTRIKLSLSVVVLYNIRNKNCHFEVCRAFLAIFCCLKTLNVRRVCFGGCARKPKHGSNERIHKTILYKSLKTYRCCHVFDSLCHSLCLCPF